MTVLAISSAGGKRIHGGFNEETSEFIYFCELGLFVPSISQPSKIPMGIRSSVSHEKFSYGSYL
jgi:hypothetical protein